MSYHKSLLPAFGLRVALRNAFSCLPARNFRPVGASAGRNAVTRTPGELLRLRRAVGFKLHSVEKCLWSYANFATPRGDIRALSTTAVEWAALASSENQRANRLKVLIRLRDLRGLETLVMKSDLIISSADSAIAERRISLPTRKSNN